MIQRISFTCLMLLALSMQFQEAVTFNSTITTICLHDYFYDPVTENCVAQCPPRYYGDYSTGTCEACDPTCYSCSGPSETECIKCRAPYSYIFQNSSGIQCLSNCSSIGANDYGSTCSFCDYGMRTYRPDGEFTDVCEDSIGGDTLCPYDFTQNKYCFDVPDQCGYSITGDSDTCTSCAADQTLLPITKDSNGIKYGSCEFRTNIDNTYLDSSIHSYVYCQEACSNCNANRTCLTCDNGKKSFGGHCVLDSCMNGTIPNQDSCDCPEGYFADPTTLQCLRCDSGCKSCFGPAPYQCLECSEGYHLHQNTTMCQKSCETGFYLDSNGSCLACDPLCYNCTGPGNDTCGVCSTFAYLPMNESPPINLPGCNPYLCHDHLIYKESRGEGICLEIDLKLGYTPPLYAGLIAFDTAVNCLDGYAYSGGDCVPDCKSGFVHGGFVPSNSHGTVSYVCQEKSSVSFQMNSTTSLGVYNIVCTHGIPYLAFKARSWFKFFYNSVQLNDTDYSFTLLDDQTLQLNISTLVLNNSKGNLEAILPENNDTSLYTPFIIKGANFTFYLSSPNASSDSDSSNPSNYDLDMLINSIEGKFAQGTGYANQIAGTVLTVAVLVNSIANFGSTTAIKVAFMMELLQFYRYVNISYPDIAMLLFDNSFQIPVNLQINFLPSWKDRSKGTIDDFENQTVYPPGKFLLYGDSAYFLDNCGNIALTLAVILGICGLFKLALICLGKTNKKKIHAVTHQTYKRFHWNYLFTILLSNFQPIALYAFLQMTSPDQHKPYGIASLVFLSIFMVILVATPGIIAFVINKYFKYKKRNVATGEQNRIELVGNEIKLNFGGRQKPAINRGNETPLTPWMQSPFPDQKLQGAADERSLTSFPDMLNQSPSKLGSASNLNNLLRLPSLPDMYSQSPSKLGSASNLDNLLKLSSVPDMSNQSPSKIESAAALYGLYGRSQREDIRLRKSEASKNHSEGAKRAEQNQEEELPDTLENYKVFFDDLKYQNRLQLLFLPIFMLRGAIFVGALALGQQNGLGQAITILIANTLFLFYILALRPYKETIQNIFLILNETVIFTVSILVLGLGAHNNSANDPNSRVANNYGLAIVICNVLLIIINLASAALDLCKATKEGVIFIKTCYRKLRESCLRKKQSTVAENQPPKASIEIAEPMKRKSTNQEDNKSLEQDNKEDDYQSSKLETEAERSKPGSTEDVDNLARVSSNKLEDKLIAIQAMNNQAAIAEEKEQHEMDQELSLESIPSNNTEHESQRRDSSNESSSNDQAESKPQNEGQKAIEIPNQ